MRRLPFQTHHSNLMSPLVSSYLYFLSPSALLLELLSMTPLPPRTHRASATSYSDLAAFICRDTYLIVLFAALSLLYLSPLFSLSVLLVSLLSLSSSVFLAVIQPSTPQIEQNVKQFQQTTTIFFLPPGDSILSLSLSSATRSISGTFCKTGSVPARLSLLPAAIPR